jgi:hypothetical protein
MAIIVSDSPAIIYTAVGVPSDEELLALSRHPCPIYYGEEFPQ